MRLGGLYVVAYVTTIVYFAIAAISQQATVVPNTWPELERLAVLGWCVALSYWLGAISHGIVVVRVQGKGE